MKYLNALLRILVGGLFIFSGFIKAVDPLGTAYKMMEYFEEFKMTFMEPLTTSFSVFMLVLEIALGVALLIGWRKKLTLTLLLLTIIFFTFLTGYTAMTGHVTDCGCFGDFLKLKPMVSFKKDLVLLAMILGIIITQRHMKPLLSDYISNTIVGIATVASVLFCFNNFLWNEPVFDFRPYAVGNHLPDLMKVKPEDQPVMKFKFKYKNTVTGQELTTTNTDTLGDTWKFVDRQDSIIKTGKPAKIANFHIENTEGEVMDNDILYNPEYNFMVCAYDLDKTDKKSWEKLNALDKGAEKDGYQFYALSASKDKFETFRHEVQAAYPFYFGDGTFVKTIMRSNPGLMLLKNGTVIAKWHKNKLPTYEEIKSQYLKK